MFRMNKRWITALCVIFFLLGAVLMAGCTVEEDPVPEGYSRVTLLYNGADGMPEEKRELITQGAAVELPTLTKQGYGFVGWKYAGLTFRDSVVIREKEVTLDALFERDVSGFSGAVVLVPEKGDPVEYSVGEYAEIPKNISEIYVSGGYKAIVYAKKDFKGRETTIAYKESMPSFRVFDRKIGSMIVRRVETDVVATFDTNEGVTDDMKAELLKLFAPRFYWTENEEFFATSMEDAKANMTRTSSETGYYYEVPEVTDEKYINEYLRGDLTKAKVYAFAVEKEYTYLDLSYFVYCPYNYGKNVVGIAFGNHVGDWEHVTVRLLLDKETHTVRPVLMEFSAHSFRFYTPYDEVEQEDGHPVAYIAERSHGIWSSAGEHVYLNAVVLKLKDICSKGKQWDSWERLETYAYDALTYTGRGIGGSEWLTCFDKNYHDPNGDAVRQWGNNKVASLIYPKLDSGPTGPQEKSSLTNYYSINSAEKFKDRLT